MTISHISRNIGKISYARCQLLASTMFNFKPHTPGSDHWTKPENRQCFHINEKPSLKLKDLITKKCRVEPDNDNNHKFSYGS